MVRGQKRSWPFHLCSLFLLWVNFLCAIAFQMDQGLWLASKTHGSLLDPQTCLSRETSPTSRPCLFYPGKRVKIGKFIEELLTLSGGNATFRSWSCDNGAHRIDLELREYLLSLQRSSVKMSLSEEISQLIPSNENQRVRVYIKFESHAIQNSENTYLSWQWV